MFLFFRKLRRKLLEGHHLGTYMLYALGEITLVVMGILIAVQIDNTNQARADREKALSYLVSYASDLRDNITELDRVIAKAQRMHTTADRLIDGAIARELPEQPLLDDAVYSLVGYTLYLSKEGTTQNLLSAGSLEIIENLTVRSSFVTQEADQKRLREVERGVYETFVELLDYAKRHIDLYQYPRDGLMIANESATALMRDRYFLNLLDDISFKYKDLELHYRHRQQGLKTLLETVDTEIVRLRR